MWVDRVGLVACVWGCVCVGVLWVCVVVLGVAFSGVLAMWVVGRVWCVVFFLVLGVLVWCVGCGRLFVGVWGVCCHLLVVVCFV